MKKTKLLTRLGAVVFALAILFAMAVPVFAADDTFEGTQSDGYGITANTNYIPITKGIVIFNPDGAQVREPDITFSYAVTPVTTAGLLGTITDSNGNKVTVNAGVANSVTGVDLDYDPTHTPLVTAPATGVEVEKIGNLEVVFENNNVATFTHAGVYRYLITETIKVNGTAVNANDLPKYGFEARTNDYSTERYLDVYIVNDATAGLKLSSAIIFKTDAVDDSNPQNTATSAITTTTDKTTGFEPSEEPESGSATIDYTNDKTADRYFTYNLKVGKTTTGSLADKNNDFPFVVTLQNDSTFIPTVTADIVNTNATSVSGTTANTVSVSSAASTVNASMSNGDYITINGLPKGTTAVVKETNNTTDEYTAAWDTMDGTTTSSVTTTRYNSSDAAQTGLAMAQNDYVVTTAVAVDGGQTVTNGDIGGDYKKTVLGYTNEISDISPTGLAFRIAPYVLMLTAGVSLIVLFIKRKRETTDMI